MSGVDLGVCLVTKERLKTTMWFDCTFWTSSNYFISFRYSFSVMIKWARGNL